MSQIFISFAILIKQSKKRSHLPLDSLYEKMTLIIYFIQINNPIIDLLLQIQREYQDTQMDIRHISKSY